MTDRDDIIEYLLQDEQVFELATSIIEHRTNPLELIGVVRIDDKSDKGEPTYEVWEGNRRVCAIMLLNDPEIAPSKWRKRFEQLSTRTALIETIEGRVFDDHNELRFWMRNIHNGAQGGQGRKDWGPDEQHRDNPTKKNAIAFSLLELAEQKGLITKTQRKGTLTTLQRYVGTASARKILEADDKDPADVVFSRAKRDFDRLLKTLIADLISNEISSRKNEQEILAYFSMLETRAGLVANNDKDDTENRDEGDGKEGAGKRAEADDGGEDEDDGPADRPAPAPTKIRRHKALAAAINRSKNPKLIDLYASLTKVPAKTNPQLIAVGCWALCETIARVCGAADNTPFTHFFSKDRLTKLGFDGGAGKSTRSAFERLSVGGNETKHDAIAATCDHRTLITDMDRVSDALAKALDE
jgi:hypothetical protein